MVYVYNKVCDVVDIKSLSDKQFYIRQSIYYDDKNGRVILISIELI